MQYPEGIDPTVFETPVYLERLDATRSDLLDIRNQFLDKPARVAREELDELGMLYADAVEVVTDGFSHNGSPSELKRAADFLLAERDIRLRQLEEAYTEGGVPAAVKDITVGLGSFLGIQWTLGGTSDFFTYPVAMSVLSWKLVSGYDKAVPGGQEFSGPVSVSYVTSSVREAVGNEVAAEQLFIESSILPRMRKQKLTRMAAASGAMAIVGAFRALGIN